MHRWKGRVALITGASSGIGAVLCRELIKHGMKVVGCARNETKIDEIAEDVSIKESSGSIKGIRCDLRIESEILAMFENIRKTYGRLDVCINNAGLSQSADLLTGSSEDWRNMLDINVLALTICTREAVKMMQENEIDDGQIIHISSMSAHRLNPLGIHFYSGTKFMVKALSEGLRKELRKLKSHIRVASVSPALVKTRFYYQLMDDPDDASELYDSIQCLEAQDVADSVIYILKSHPRVEINDILMRPTEQED